MIGTYLAAAFGIAKRIPREVWYLLGVALFLWWFSGIQYDRGYDKRTAEYETARLEVIEKARKADAVGVSKAQAGKAATEAGNERAREAARDSEDPLRDGLGALR